MGWFVDQGNPALVFLSFSLVWIVPIFCQTPWTDALLGGATRRKPRSACREDSESPASFLAGIPFTARPPFTTSHRTGRCKADGGQRVMMLTEYMRGITLVGLRSSSSAGSYIQRDNATLAADKRPNEVSERARKRKSGVVKECTYALVADDGSIFFALSPELDAPVSVIRG